jgi:hypothetical protein
LQIRALTRCFIEPLIKQYDAFKCATYACLKPPTKLTVTISTGLQVWSGLQEKKSRLYLPASQYGISLIEFLTASTTTKGEEDDLREGCYHRKDIEGP